MIKLKTIERILEPFVDEMLTDGGIDMTKSRWQKPGRGYGGISPDHPDVRYMRALVDVLYRVNKMSGNSRYLQLANNQTHFMVRFTKEADPTWHMGTTLECIGFYHQYNTPDTVLKEAALRIVNWARRRKVIINTGKISYGHFPCGYGLDKLNAKDSGWVNDLGIFGSGLVWAYEVTKDTSILDDAISFAEYFVQPWKSGSLGIDGYWHAGTWRDDMGTWVIGPLHYKGVESTDAYTDESSWLFSTFPCIDYLTHLFRYKPDPRFLERCFKAAQWTFEKCQFEDGSIGLCGKDDKWLGTTGYAISQVVLLCKIVGKKAIPPEMLTNAKRSYQYLCEHLPNAKLEEHGIEWVTHRTLTDPLVNVGWMWLNALLGLLDGEELYREEN